MKKFLIQSTCFFVSLLMLASCRKGPDRDIEYRIYVTHSSLEMVEGEEIQITASPTEQTFTWESANTDVVSVSSTGLVRAVKDGLSEILVTSSGGLRRTIPVNVLKYLPLEGIDVSNRVTTAPVTSLVLLFGQTIALEAAPAPKNYNEKIPFSIIWESSDEEIVTVDQNGTVTAIKFGNAEIIVSSVERPSVKTVIPVEVMENPITEIRVSKTSLQLILDGTVTIETSFLPTNYSVKDASLVWESSDESIVKVTDGKLQAVDPGSATVTVSLNSDPSVMTNISVTVLNPPATTVDFSTFVNAGNNLVSSSITFERGTVTEISGMDAATVATIYNRDFFTYNPDKNRLVFTGASGAWDVFYSLEYNFIWVARMSDVAPACYWIVGSGFACPPVWHNDFYSGGWSTDNMRQMAYMRAIGDGKYQTTIYIGDAGFDFCVYANRGWGGQVYHPTMIAPGITLHSSGGDLIAAPGFETGYYRFIFDEPNWTFILEKID